MIPGWIFRQRCASAAASIALAAPWKSSNSVSCASPLRRRLSTRREGGLGMNKPALIDPAAIGEAAPDPFDVESLRLNQSFVETVGTKKLLTMVPVKKPNAQDFVR